MNRFKNLDWIEAAPRWFGRGAEQLGAAERKALQHAALREALTEDPNHKLDETSTFGQRLADKVAAFGGSWTFISIFATFLILFVRAIESFEVPALLGLPVGIQVFTSSIYQAVHRYPSQIGLASAYAITLLLITTPSLTPEPAQDTDAAVSSEQVAFLR